MTADDDIRAMTLAQFKAKLPEDGEIFIRGTKDGWLMQYINKMPQWSVTVNHTSILPCFKEILDTIRDNAVAVAAVNMPGGDDG